MAQRPEQQLPDASRRRERGPIGIYLVMIVLLLFIGSLIVNSYLSQVELRKQNRTSLVHEAEKRATALAYFLAERRNDVTGLLYGPGLKTLFANRALGTSPEHGWSSSLEAARREFVDLVESRRLGDELVYSRRHSSTPRACS